MIRSKAGTPPRHWSRRRRSDRRSGRRFGARIVGSTVVLAAGAGLVLHVRQVMLRQVRQTRAVAGTTRSRSVRPMSTRIDGLATAAVRLSAERGAGGGGDLYDVISTEHGVRVVMGDVRGHGLSATDTVAAVLGGFREAVHHEADLAGVLGRLDRALARHLRDRVRTEDHEDAEEFVTVLLLQIAPDGQIHALNCGHPWPYLLSAGRAELLARADPMPPLGMFPLPAELPSMPCGPLLPGEALFLHTDGVEDARDVHGAFFPLSKALAASVRGRPISPQSVLRAVFTQLLRHTGGRPKDDIAILLLRNDRLRAHAAVLRGWGQRRSAAPPRGATGPHAPAPDNPPVVPGA